MYSTKKFVVWFVMLCFLVYVLGFCYCDSVRAEINSSTISYLSNENLGNTEFASYPLDGGMLQVTIDQVIRIEEGLILKLKAAGNSYRLLYKTLNDETILKIIDDENRVLFKALVSDKVNLTVPGADDPY